MEKVVAFFKLIRWPNLFFIALSQALFQYCIIHPIFGNTQPVFTHLYFLLLLTTSITIAAAGYIINDYFDVNIDVINKPDKLYIDKTISRRWAIFWHSFLSFTGVAVSFYIGYKIGIFWIGFANLFCTVLLFVYSTTFKRKFLSGNIIIAALTAWSVAILGFTTFYVIIFNRPLYSGVGSVKILWFTIIYASFAFITSLVREAIKDIEDMEGDLKYECKTMPIVAGIPATKMYIAVWIVVLIGAVGIMQLYALKSRWWLATLYSILLLILPLINLLLQSIKAKRKEDFHQLSNLTKLIMLSGILSMIFFKLYI
ncbi:MAG TPA: geranylgeranylglycerol-phosphate geranylgeranyltransferase [Chitinophagaceae bacterium]|jgi:4-hydroxybenzoate polyprenyltransferase|nr:geranylgeranylglycerol-phosphate geranylgeranyltransferase [Chitinophagaceae bacterium]